MLDRAQPGTDPGILARAVWETRTGVRPQGADEPGEGT